MTPYKFRAWDKETNCWSYGNSKNGLCEFFKAIKSGVLDGGTLAIYDDETEKWEYICEEPMHQSF